MANPSVPVRRHAWRRVLIVNLLLYLVGLLLLVGTGNPNLFPTVVMLGSFMIPVAYVAFFYERSSLMSLTLPTVAKGFVYGGILGVFGAALLEPFFVRHLDFLTAFTIGLIEEAAKIIGLLIIIRHHHHTREVDGIILGAAVGMGFAALESSGYAFTAFLASGGSLSATVGTTLLRGILSPLGHGTWTAILAGVLFRESLSGRFRFNRNVIGAYFAVAVLHGLWDGLPSLLAFFRAPGVDYLIAEGAVGVTGLWILWRRWREAKHVPLPG